MHLFISAWCRMSSEEDDYMSDKYLTDEKHRPSLIQSRKTQREYEVVTKKARLDEEVKLKNKPTKVKEKERLEEGLSNAITSSNKGFAMLTKMGYKQGQSIGKTTTGIVEPIGITVKTDRYGLGRSTAIKELHERRTKLLENKLNSRETKELVSADEFRKRLSQKRDLISIENSLRKCQKTLESLDRIEGIEEPALPWFWPQYKFKEEVIESDNEDEEEEFDSTEKLEMIIKFLRTTYNYCIWCGVNYNDLNDMEENCPGANKDDH